MRQLMRHPGASTRLIVIVAMLVIGVAINVMSGRMGALPAGKLYEMSRQRILQADLMFRMGQYLDLVMPDESVPGLGGARQLQERAVAEYEREALVGRPNPASLHRLGIIYGTRGYSEQARQVLVRAATLDEPQAALYFALASVFSREGGTASLSAEGLRAVQEQEQWLAGLVLPVYYRQLGQSDKQREAQAHAEHETRQFGGRLLTLLVIYGTLGLIGLAILGVALFQWGFTVRQAPRVRPPLVVPWGSLDALEIAATLYFAMAATGVLAALATSRLLSDAPDLVRVLVVALQYLGVTAAVIALLWHRTAGESRRKLSILGVRVRDWGRLLAQGIGGYAVLVVLLVVLTLMVPGRDLLSPAWGQTSERVLLSAQSVAARAGMFLLICLLAPILEELIFRGFVYPGLRRRLSPNGAILGSALLFALMHNNVAAILPITLIGIVLAVLYERSRSLIPSMICHALNNTLVFFLMMLTA